MAKMLILHPTIKKKIFQIFGPFQFHFWGRAMVMALGNPASRVIKKHKRLLHLTANSQELSSLYSKAVHVS